VSLGLAWQVVGERAATRDLLFLGRISFAGAGRWRGRFTGRVAARCLGSPFLRLALLSLFGRGGHPGNLVEQLR
jgi:hypothetical protein